MAPAASSSQAAPADGDLPNVADPGDPSPLPQADAVAPDPIDTASATMLASSTSQVLGLLRSIVGTADGGTTTSDASDGTPGAAAPDPAAPASASSAAVRNGVVTLELSPADLGRVTVTLRMRANSVDVRIAVDNKDTLSVLNADRHVLSDALGGTQATLDLAYAPPSSQAGAATSAPTTADGQTPQAGADARSDRSGRDGERRPDPSTLKVTDNDSSAATAGRRDDGLYL